MDNKYLLESTSEIEYDLDKWKYLIQGFNCYELCKVGLNEDGDLIYVEFVYNKTNDKSFFVKNENIMNMKLYIRLEKLKKIENIFDDL